MMDDWLEDPLMFLKEGSLSYRQHKSLGTDACKEWETFHFSSRLKLEAVDHFCRLALGMASMSDDMGHPLLAYKQTKWYLDAFFFELMSAYDTLLQEMNVVYAINLDMEEVTWGSIRSKLPSAVVDLMGSEREAEWFKRLRWYRNRATHHMYIPGGWEKGGWGEMPWDYDHHQIVLAYFDAGAKERREEDIKVCPDYLKKMLEHIHAVWAEMTKEFD